MLAAYGDVLRSPTYLPLWVGQLVSNFGDTLHYIALVVLVFQLTGQGLAVAGVVAAEALPVLLFGPIAGVVIDRFSRKAVLIGADLVRAGLVLSLLWPQGAWHAYVVATGLSLGNTFFNPTVQAVIPALTTPEQRLAANSVAWSTGRLVQIIASAIAGGVIAAVGTSAALALNAATFVVSALLITQLPIPAHAGQLGVAVKQRLRSYLADAKAGLRYAWHDALVLRLLIVQGLASLAVGATSALLVVLSEQHLGLPPAGFAWLIGAIGAGALLGPLIPNALACDRRDARWLFVPYVIRGLGDVLLASFTPLPIALLLLFVYGLNTSAGGVVFRTVLQDAIPDAVRGRIYTLLDVTWSAMRLVSLAVGGVLVDAIGIRPLFWSGGTLLAIAGVLGLALFGRASLPAARPAPGWAQPRKGHATMPRRRWWEFDEHELTLVSRASVVGMAWAGVAVVVYAWSWLSVPQPLWFVLVWPVLAGVAVGSGLTSDPVWVLFLVGVFGLIAGLVLGGVLILLRRRRAQSGV